MSQPRPTDPIGSIGWTERTGGVLTARECLTLARPLLRGAQHSCRPSRDGAPNALRTPEFHRSGEPGASRLPSRKRCRGRRAGPLDTGTPQPFQCAYTWGAAIAALHGITFDRELLYLAAMFHDTGIPSPVPDVDFTVRSAALAREFTDSHHVPADIREPLQTRSPCTTPPALASNPVPRPTSYLPAQPSMCSAYAATRYPMQSARASSRSTRGWASSGSSPGFSEPRPSKSLVAAPGTCTASP